ncbi:MAG: exodeoxyribonuclease V subunit gamma [Planctomycetota bacterium]
MDVTQLSIETCNHLEVLLERLAGRMRQAPLPPLQPEIVVVQSQGMGRWVTLELARRLGVAGSLEMPFPAKFCDDLARRLGLAEAPVIDPFDREILTWRLFRTLDPIPAGKAFDPVRTYLRGDDTGIRRFQLAARVASRFDDYQIYRPEMLVGWESGELRMPEQDSASREHEAWQAALWQRLVAETPHPPLAFRFRGLLEALHRSVDRSLLPSRITVFGISSLPPIFLKVLGALARTIPVTIAFVSPTPEFWGDLRSEKEDRRRGQLSFDWEAPERPLRDRAPTNPLLANLGRQGRELFTLLQELDETGQAWEELDHLPPARDSLLHDLQADIVELIDRRVGAAHEPITRSAGDNSLELHACHSPRREMEVLRNLLFDAFETDPELTPDQVLVLVPDIARYAPFIQAVFDVDSDDTPRLPIHIADRAARQEHPLVGSFLLLLRTARSRFTVTDLLGLLDQAPIRRAFGIAESDLPVLQDWVDATRVTWGLDKDQRSADHDLPAFESPTWRSAIDRMLLGFATGPTEGAVSGILPYAEPLAGRAELLGRLAELFEVASRHLLALRESHGAAEWTSCLHAALDDLFRAADVDEEEALVEVRRACGRLGTLDELGPGEQPIHPAVLEEHFEQVFSVDSFGRGFLNGRITFCALKPMRTIPFRLIAVAGLDDGAFPRPTRSPHFDLIERKRRLGDRSLRDDDRYLFLETLLAARERLVLSWVGQSQKDDSRPAPSLCVSELLEHLERMLGSTEAADALIVWHKMHAFSTAYFDGEDDRLFSYSSEECAAGTRSLEDRLPLSPFITEPLTRAAPSMSEPIAELAQLTELWVHPSKYFCRHSLQILLRDEEISERSQEPFGLDGLDKYFVDSRLLARANEGPLRPEAEWQTLGQSGRLPARELGRIALSRRCEEITEFARRVGPTTFDDPATGELVIGDWRLRGRVELQLGDGARVLARPSTVKSKDLLRGWISHLFLCGLSEQGRSVPTRTRILGRESAWEIRPVSDWRARLAELLDGFLEGQSTPLPFFERASYEYAKSIVLNGKTHEEAVQAAEKVWLSEKFSKLSGESEDFYIALCQRQRRPLESEAWAERALHVWRPLFESAEPIDA